MIKINIYWVVFLAMLAAPTLLKIFGVAVIGLIEAIGGIPSLWGLRK